MSYFKSVTTLVFDLSCEILAENQYILDLLLIQTKLLLLNVIGGKRVFISDSCFEFSILFIILIRF